MQPAESDIRLRPSTSGRVQRRTEKTRQRLIEVALELFATRGYDQTSMDLVAAGAEVARTTVFNHFSRKDQLLRAGLAGRREQVGERLRSTRGVLSTQERVRDALGMWAGAYEVDPAKGIALVRAWVQAGGPHLLDAALTADLFTELVRDGQAAGDLRLDIDSGVAGLVLFDCAVGALVRWAAPVEEGRPTDLFAAMRAGVDLAMVAMLLQQN